MSSVGMMRAVMASTSAACSGVKNSSFAVPGDFAAWRALAEAARSAGQFAESQTVEMPVKLLERKSRRVAFFSINWRKPETIDCIVRPEWGQAKSDLALRFVAAILACAFAVRRKAGVGFRRSREFRRREFSHRRHHHLYRRLSGHAGRPGGAAAKPRDCFWRIL